MRIKLQATFMDKTTHTVECDDSRDVLYTVKAWMKDGITINLKGVSDVVWHPAHSILSIRTTWL